MAMVITNKGLNSIADADAGGFKVDIDTFAVSSAVGARPSIESEALVGDILYRSEVQSIEVVDANKVKFTLYIPPGYPREGNWNLTEVGLYLKTGELFAHGTFKSTFEKTPEFGLRVTCIVVVARLGEVINFTLGLNASLASAASVRTLIDPFESETNAVVVQDAITNHENVAALTSASLAVRYGAGGNYWAFLGHDLVYKGYPIDVESASKFKLRAEIDGGFWLDDQEIVNIQITSGNGSGQSRRVQYDRTKGEFNVLEKPFTAMGKQSLMHVWRSTKNQLPKRPVDIKSHYVLGAGVNTWKRLTNEDAVIGKCDLIPARIVFQGDGNKSEFKLPAEVKETVYQDKANFSVFVGGEYIGQDQFSVTPEKGVTFISRVPQSDQDVDVFYYTRVESKGSALTCAVVEYSADGTEWTFQNSIVPPSSDYMMVFLNGKLVSADAYDLQGTGITFKIAPPVGSIVIVACANLQELGAGTTIIRKESSLRVVVGNTTPIDLGTTQVERKNTFVSVGGVRLDHSEYDVEDGQLKVKTIFPTSTPVSILAFANTVDDVVIERFTGENSGPVWTDPAGRYIDPNRIQAMVTTFIGNGNQTVYSMNANATAAWVFIDGLFQDPAPITVQTNNSTIILPQPLAAGSKIDIISFQAIADSGQEVKCSRQLFNTEAGKTVYGVDPSEDGVARQMTVVSVGGVYQHMDTYVLGLNNITFNNELPVNARVQLWHFGTKVHEGYSNALSWSNHKMDRSITEYVHEYYDSIPINDAGDVNNALMFTNTVMQYGDQYSVTNGDSYKFNILEPEEAHGIAAVSFVFYTGESKTRLMTRDEMKKRYMTREEIMKLALGGGGYDPDIPTDPDDPGTPAPGGGTGAKVLDLTATSQVFAVTNEGIGVPNLITFTANPQNVTGNVVYSVIGGEADISFSGKNATLAFSGMRTEFVTIRARVTDTDRVSYFDDITVVKLHEGKDAVTAILSNETHSIPADVSGAVSSYSGALTNMEVYRGSVRETSEWSFERSNSVGIESTINRNQVAITKMTVAQGYVDIQASRDGFSPIVKRFSVTLSKTGQTGPAGAAGAATYGVLTSDAFIFAASPTGVVTDFSQGKTEMRVIQNNIDETSKWAFSRVNSDGVASAIAGNAVSITSFAQQNDTGSVTISATRAGQPTLTKVFSLSKIKGSTGSGNGVEGPRGSMNFYVPSRTSWSDSVAANISAFGAGPKLNDVVHQYSSSFSQSRFWNGTAWVILDQKINGNLLVDGTVGANALSVGAIKANSAVIEDGAIGTLKIGGNAVTLTQAIRQPNQNQITIAYTGPVDPQTSMSDSSANPILSMIVNVTGSQPCLVWAAWSNPGCYEVASGADQSYWGKAWKQTTNMTEVVALFTMTNTRTGAVYKAGQLSSSLFPGGTTTMATNAIFQNIPAGTYVLSLCMAKAYVAGQVLQNFACRGASLTFLETKR